MTEAEKKALKEQLGEMAKQLQKLANLDQRKKQLEEARKNGGLSKEQFEQEMAKLNDQAKGLQKLQKLAAKLGQAQQQLEKGDMKKAAEALGMSQQQLTEMAKQLQELEALDGALADLQDAKNGMTGDGMNQLGESLDGLGMDRRAGERPEQRHGPRPGRGRPPRGPRRDRALQHQGQAAVRQGEGGRRRVRPPPTADEGPERHRHPGRASRPPPASPPRP